MREARLTLDDGSIFIGKSFGWEEPVTGEVVFNTAMTGYPESLTDPSYAGQILVLTYPLVGNYGVPPATIGEDGLSVYLESGRIHVRALIVSDYSAACSHWNCARSLADWLKDEKIPAITDIDTRALTKHLREKGVMLGRIDIAKTADEDSLAEKETIEFQEYGNVNYVARVSCTEPVTYNAGAPKKVVLVDCGVKHNIIRCLVRMGVEVTRVPWDYDFNSLDFDGLFLSNGPGNPDLCPETVEHIRKTMEDPKKPIFGICMGNQLLGKAAGAKIYKLRYGHRSHNQPVRLVGTEKCYITSQNHGYAVDDKSLPAEWEPLFVNMNDGSNEGIRHRSNPWFSVQFHPEAASGPLDTEFLFDEFVKLL